MSIRQLKLHGQNFIMGSNVQGHRSKSLYFIVTTLASSVSIGFRSNFVVILPMVHTINHTILVTIGQRSRSQKIRKIIHFLVITRSNLVVISPMVQNRNRTILVSLGQRSRSRSRSRKIRKSPFWKITIWVIANS